MWLSEEKFKFIGFPPLLPVLAIVLRKAVPSRQLFDRVTKNFVFIVAGSPRFARSLDTVFQILYEIIEAEQVPVDETSIKSTLDQNLQLAKAEHGNGALPAEPDEAVVLRPQFVVGVAEKAPNEIPIEFAAQGDHGEGLAHARPDELLGIGIENDVEERLRVSVIHRSHDVVAGLGCRISQDRTGFVSGTPKQTRQRSVGCPLPPLPEQMKDEEERRRVLPCGRFLTEVFLDHPEELRQQFGALRRGRLQCLCWKTRGVGKFV